MYVSTYLCLPTYVYPPLSTYLCLPSYIYLPISTFLYLPTYIYLPISTYLYLPTYIYLPISTCLSLTTYIYLPLPAYLCKHTYHYISVYNCCRRRSRYRSCFLCTIQRLFMDYYSFIGITNGNFASAIRSFLRRRSTRTLAACTPSCRFSSGAMTRQRIIFVCQKTSSRGYSFWGISKNWSQRSHNFRMSLFVPGKLYPRRCL